MQFSCYRQKLLSQIKYQIQITDSEIILIKDLEIWYRIKINLKCRLDWKIKGNKILAVGINKDKCYWFFSDHNNLFQMKQILGGRVWYRGISDQYKPLNQIGQGTFSNVYLLQSQLDQKHFCSKCIDKEQVEQGEIAIEDEIKNLLLLKNEYTVKLIEIYEGDVQYYLIMEYLNIELVDIIKSGQLKIVEIQKILQQLLQSVNIIHSQNYMHRDLKPENIMFSQSTDHLKIIDFGLVARGLSVQKCGTPGYVAPEVLNGELYNYQCDIFSIGVIMYKLFTKQDLFQGKNKDDLIIQNKKSDILLKLRDPRIHSNNAQDLLQKMLEMNPLKRITAKDALDHHFFNEIFLDVNSPIHLRKSSSIYKALSPLQQQRDQNNNISSFFLDEYQVNTESPMQPLPHSNMRVQISNFEQLGVKKYGTSNHLEVVNIYRAPKPRQLQELYESK